MDSNGTGTKGLSDEGTQLTELIAEGLKPGVKTTEFWLSAAAVALPYVMTWLDQISAEWAVVASSLVAGAYAAARAYAKRRAAALPHAN